MPRANARLSREEKKAMTRTKLLDAAAIVFARKGFNGASLDDVADEAGLTKGAVYSNFGSKDDLIQTLLEQRLGEPQYTIADQVDATASREEQAKQAGELFIQMFERNRDMHLLDLEFMAHMARNPDLAGRRDSYLRRVDAMAASMEEHAAAAGETLPLPARELTIALFSLGNGIVMERLINPGFVPDDLFARVLNLILSSSTSQPPGNGGKAKR
jgi:AcrR family transcriptional regulator